MGNIAVITARCGSKGLKNKNIRVLNGKPLMAYSIEAAKESECFECIHVSTDSEKYADIAVNYGAEVPFLRAAELAADTSSTWDVLRDVLKRYQKAGKHFEQIMLLQPTSPLRNAEDIKNAFSIMNERKAMSVISVCEMEHSPLWSNTLPEDGNMNHFLSRIDNLPRQQLQIYYRINGAVYLINTDYLLNKGELYGKDSYAYIMPKIRSIDIDDLFDFKMAEIYMQNKVAY